MSLLWASPPDGAGGKRGRSAALVDGQFVPAEAVPGSTERLPRVSDSVQFRPRPGIAVALAGLAALAIAACQIKNHDMAFYLASGTTAPAFPAQCLLLSSGPELLIGASRYGTGPS